MLKQWINDYKKSLKLLEVEEFFDLTFYRPLAFLFVKLIYNTNISPNQITYAAIAFSLTGGIIYSFGGSTFFAVGALFFMFYNIMDCADGQLARLKGNGTSIGRIVDGFADYIAGTMAYLAIGVGFASQTSNPLFYYLLTLAAAVSNILHAITLDYYRNRYLDYALRRDNMLGNDLKNFRDEYEEVKKESGHYFDKLLFKLYFFYSAIQFNFAAKNSDRKQKTFEREDFLARNKKIIWFWTFIGPTTQWTFFIITSLLNMIEYYLWGMVLVFNLLVVILYFIQVYINSKTLINQSE